MSCVLSRSCMHALHTHMLETTTPAYTTPGGDIFLQVPPVLDNTALYSVWPYGPTEKKDCYCTLLGFEECPCVNKTAYTVELIKDTESNGQYTYTLHLNNLTNRLNDTRLFFFYESQATSCDGTYIALTQRFESTVRIIIGGKTVCYMANNLFSLLNTCRCYGIGYIMR